MKTEVKRLIVLIGLLLLVAVVAIFFGLPQLRERRPVRSQYEIRQDELNKERVSR